jgi:starch synthase
VKVTFFTWEYPPNVYGGVGIHVKYLTQALKDKVELEIRTVDAGGQLQKGEEIKVRRYKPWKALSEGREPRFARVFDALSLNLAFVKDPVNSDLVHAHTWMMDLAGFYAKELYGVKLVATVHSLEPKRPWKEEALGRGYRLSGWAEKTGLEACDRIIAVSSETKKDITDCYGIAPEKIEVIHNGIDDVKYRKREDLTALEAYKVTRPYVLFVGRLSRQKGIFDLVEASEKFPRGVKLVLLTGKPDEANVTEELENAVRNRKNIVWINKMLTEDEIIVFYSGAEVFCAPSTYEPFGIMNLEAMACETPVVSTKVGGIKDAVVDGETGILVAPERPDEIAEAVNRILADKDLARRMGKNGRKRVEAAFSWKRIAEKTYALYENLLEK